MERDYCKNFCKDKWGDCEYLCNRDEKNYPINWAGKCIIATMYDMFGVVHCCDCEYGFENGFEEFSIDCRHEHWYADGFYHTMKENDHCSYGKLRKE